MAVSKVHNPLLGGLPSTDGSDASLGRTNNPFATRLDGVTEQELEESAFYTPVATLLDLWFNKYGYAWIDVSEIERDPFYSLAYLRLKSLGELEVHYLTDRSKYVCRKPPK